MSFVMSFPPSRCVAPFAGAWIEINNFGITENTIADVAPFAGAWIEINQL